jgi:hypothetical protein
MCIRNIEHTAKIARWEILLKSSCNAQKNSRCGNATVSACGTSSCPCNMHEVFNVDNFIAGRDEVIGCLLLADIIRHESRPADTSGELGKVTVTGDRQPTVAADV